MASSQVPICAAYLHLAYTVAHAGPNRKAGPGIAGIAIGLAMAITVFPLTRRCKPLLKTLSRCLIFIAAALLILLGTSWYLSFRAERKRGYLQKTEVRMEIFDSHLEPGFILMRDAAQGIFRERSR